MTGRAGGGADGARRGFRMPGQTIPSVAVVAVMVLAVGVALSGWALSVLLAPPGRAAESGRAATATVVEGEVGSELALNATAEWLTTPVGSNEAAGIVTGVDLAAGLAADAVQGTRLYSVNGRTVVVARGEVPAYRPLALGRSGEDVRQQIGRAHV